MPIYRKILADSNLKCPTNSADIPGLSPIKIQSGTPNFSFIATLNVSALEIINPPVNWGLLFEIIQGNNTLGSYWLGSSSDMTPYSFSFSAVGDVSASGLTEDIHVKWRCSNGLKVVLKGPTSFTILMDDRLN